MTDEKKMNNHYGDVQLKPNTKIKVGWYMNKYQAFDSRVGIFDDKSKQFVSKSGVPCLTFWDTLRNRYTTATNFILNILGDTDDISNS